jgi:hypothetical protein
MEIVVAKMINNTAHTALLGHAGGGGIWAMALLPSWVHLDLSAPLPSSPALISIFVNQTETYIIYHFVLKYEEENR